MVIKPSVSRSTPTTVWRADDEVAMPGNVAGRRSSSRHRNVAIRRSRVVRVGRNAGPGGRSQVIDGEAPAFEVARRRPVRRRASSG